MKDATIVCESRKKSRYHKCIIQAPVFHKNSQVALIANRCWKHHATNVYWPPEETHTLFVGAHAHKVFLECPLQQESIDTCKYVCVLPSHVFGTHHSCTTPFGESSVTSAAGSHTPNRNINTWDWFLVFSLPLIFQLLVLIFIATRGRDVPFPRIIVYTREQMTSHSELA